MEARFYFIIREPEKNYIVAGPPLAIGEKYIKAFKKKWKKAFVKNKRLYAKAKRDINNINQILKIIPVAQLKEMGIKKMPHIKMVRLQVMKTNLKTEVVEKKVD